MKKNEFSPTEIIFSITDLCNLNCAHCYVKRKNLKLDIDLSIKFLNECKPYINLIGFTGGEPFLYMEFLESIIKNAVENDFMFDRIMTNGIWWKTQEELNDKLLKLYNAGFDGKIGISIDSFHNPDFDKILTFINSIYKIWNNFSMIEIQSVNNDSIKDNIFFEKLAEKLNCNTTYIIDKKTNKGIIYIKNKEVFIPVYKINQSYSSDDINCWKDKKWFKDDYCKSTGNIFFIHPDGKIAPCCGFANENSALIIGNISDSYEKIMEQAKNNFMVNTCFTYGLKKYKNKLKLKGTKFMGITNEVCSFCDYVCKNYSK